MSIKLIFDLSNKGDVEIHECPLILMPCVQFKLINVMSI